MNGDPWRFRCPECDSVLLRRISEPRHPACKEPKRFHCEGCGTYTDHRVDAKTGEMVA